LVLAIGPGEDAGDVRTRSSHHEDRTMPTSLQEIPLVTISGDEASLGDHAGSVLLVVNVASKCGLTPQYEQLEALYEDRRDQGFAVLGFPANDFGAQEPGTDEEIAAFCATSYAVEFPLFSKISVVGEDQHPLYRELTTAIPRAEGDPDSFRERLRGFGIAANDEPDILWNFEKFLVARDGTVVRRFAPSMTPDDPIIVAAIDEQLAR
jgi:glutathione peroxidase